MRMHPKNFVRFMKRVEEIGGHVEFTRRGQNHVATIEELQFGEGVLAIVAPNDLVVIGADQYTPMLDNEPTVHRFCWPQANLSWVGAVDYDHGKICVMPEEPDVDMFYVVIDGHKLPQAA